jgi:hypothetical protein
MVWVEKGGGGAGGGEEKVILHFMSGKGKKKEEEVLGGDASLYTFPTLIDKTRSGWIGLPGSEKTVWRLRLSLRRSGTVMEHVPGRLPVPLKSFVHCGMQALAASSLWSYQRDSWQE